MSRPPIIPPEVPCPNCDGLGRVRTERTCTTCKGEGFYGAAVADRRQLCPACGGAGVLVKRCLACGGSGYVSPWDREPMPCRACGFPAAPCNTFGRYRCSRPGCPAYLDVLTLEEWNAKQRGERSTTAEPPEGEEA